MEEFNLGTSQDNNAEFGEQVKTMLTSIVLRKERKNRDGFDVLNTTNVMTLTNNRKDLFPKDRVARRWNAYDVGTKRVMQMTEAEKMIYFKNLASMMQSPIVMKIFCHMLDRRDLSSVNIHRNKESTVQKTTKVRNLTQFDDYWRRVLQAKVHMPREKIDALVDALPDGHQSVYAKKENCPDDGDWVQVIPIQYLYHHYRANVQTTGGRPMGQSTFIANTTDLLGNIYCDNGDADADDMEFMCPKTHTTFIRLPPLKTARARYALHHGFSADYWDKTSAAIPQLIRREKRARPAPVTAPAMNLSLLVDDEMDDLFITTHNTAPHPPQSPTLLDDEITAFIMDNE